jgi:hypothetical protein
MRTIFYLFLFLPALLIAQSGSITSAGENRITHSNIVSWSIGSTLSSISHSKQYTVYEGHDPVLDIYKILLDDENKLDICCYPNPTNDGFFYTELSTHDIFGLEWHLYSTSGELIKSGRIEKNIFKIDISRFTSSAYILYVLDTDKRRIASAKLLKK